MKVDNTYESFLQYKLNNFLKGQALQITLDTSMDDDKRKKAMEDIEAMTLYIRNYRENKNKLVHYDELLKEYHTHIDDGR